MAGKKTPTGGSSSHDGGQRNLHVRVKTAKGRKISSTNWLKRQLNDPYVHRAMRDGYRSRAAYKLIEIDDKYHFLSKGANVVDLGAAPGGWLQVASKRVGHGIVVGIDLQAIEPIGGTIIFHHDFMADDAPELLAQAFGDKPINVVLSDMAAPACGHPPTDHIRIMALCEAALHFAKQNLAQGGTFVSKVLKGGAEKDILADMKKCFRTVKHVKPDSSRKDSAESYIIATGFRGTND